MTDYRGQRFGNYQLIDVLGHGGYAHVYLGEQVFLKTRAAIKVIDASLEPEKVERFRFEAGIIARLDHPNIVRLLDFGVENAVPYLVMDYAPNGTLRQRHPRGTPVPLPIVVRYVQQIAAALDYAHQHRLIHRDIKPENLLLGRKNEVLLSDFGIAVVSHQTTSLTTQDEIGTVSYMAPEQLKRKPRPASDQYALAVVVYEWLTGNPPFQGSPIETAMQHLETPPPSMREPGSPINADVERVVLRALEKHWQMRYTSVGDFARALQTAYSPLPPFIRVPSGEPSSDPSEHDDLPDETPAGAPLPDLLPDFELALQEALAAQENKRRAPEAAGPAPNDSSGKRQTDPDTAASAGSRLPTAQRTWARRLNRRKALLAALALLLLLALSVGGLLLALGSQQAPRGDTPGLISQIQGTPQHITASPGSSPLPTRPATPAPRASATPTAPGATPTATPPGDASPTATTAPPNLSVSPRSLSFPINLLNCLAGNHAQTLTLVNIGGSNLSWQSSVSTGASLIITPGSGSLGPEGSAPVQVAVNCAKLTLSERDTITFTWNSGSLAVAVTISLS